MPHALNLNHAAARRQVESGCNLFFVFNDLRSNDLGIRSEAAARHLLRIAHQLVEMNARRSYKSSGATPAFNDAFPLEPRQGMTRRHQTHPMNPGEFSLRIHRVAWP